MNGFFKTPWGIFILIIIGGISVLFAAGVWYMIGIGLIPALGIAWSYALASIVSPLVALLSIMTFMYGKQWQKYISDYEYSYGKDAVHEDGRVHHYENKWSRVHLITMAKLGALGMDSAGIFYRLTMEQISLPGKILLGIFLHLLAVSPWVVGEIAYMIAHRPVQAVRRDAMQTRERMAIQEEVKETTRSKKHAPLPAHMRKELPSPPEQVFTQALVKENQQSQNGTK